MLRIGSALLLLLVQDYVLGVPVNQCSKLYDEATVCLLDLQRSEDLRLIVERRTWALSTCAANYPQDCTEEFETRKTCLTAAFHGVRTKPEYEQLRNAALAAADECFEKEPPSLLEGLDDLIEPRTRVDNVLSRGHGDSMGSFNKRPECEETEAEATCIQKQLSELDRIDSVFSNAITSLLDRKAACMRRLPRQCQVNTPELKKCIMDSHEAISRAVKNETDSCIRARRGVGNTTQSSVTTTASTLVVGDLPTPAVVVWAAAKQATNETSTSTETTTVASSESSTTTSTESSTSSTTTTTSSIATELESTSESSTSTTTSNTESAVASTTTESTTSTTSSAVTESSTSSSTAETTTSVTESTTSTTEQPTTTTTLVTESTTSTTNVAVVTTPPPVVPKADDLEKNFPPVQVQTQF